MKLYAFPISHFSEKARWSLDYLGVDYTYRPLAPVQNVPPPAG